MLLYIFGCLYVILIIRNALSALIRFSLFLQIIPDPSGKLKYFDKSNWSAFLFPQSVKAQIKCVFIKYCLVDCLHSFSSVYSFSLCSATGNEQLLVMWIHPLAARCLEQQLIIKKERNISIIISVTVFLVLGTVFVLSFATRKMSALQRVHVSPVSPWKLAPGAARHAWLSLSIYWKEQMSLHWSLHEETVANSDWMVQHQFARVGYHLPNWS